MLILVGTLLVADGLAGVARGTVATLLSSSALGLELGLPTFLAGIVTTALVLSRSRCRLTQVMHGISWGVLPLVVGLLVLVEGLERTGVTRTLAGLLHDLAQRSGTLAARALGGVLAVGCNLMNNLPAGLLAGRVVELADVPDSVRAAVLIGVDLGPNLYGDRLACHPPVARCAAARGT